MNNVFVILDVLFCIWMMYLVFGTVYILVIYYIVLGIFDGAQGASKECIAMALTSNIGSCQPQSQSTIEGPKPIMWTPP